MAKFEHKFLFGGVVTPNEREQRSQELNAASDDGWTVAEAHFVQGGVFYALLRRPVAEKGGAK